MKDLDTINLVLTGKLAKIIRKRAADVDTPIAGYVKTKLEYLLLQEALPADTKN